MKNVISIFLLIIVLSWGCDRHGIYDQYQNLKKEQWHKDSLKSFNFDITDSTAIYSMYVNIRNTGKYSFSNLIIFVETEIPGNKQLRDTLDCTLANNKGEWLGSGFGSIWSNKIPYKTKIRFPRKGNYRVKIQHGMRKEVLKGITDIGIRIEKVY